MTGLNEICIPSIHLFDSAQRFCCVYSLKSNGLFKKERLIWYHNTYVCGMEFLAWWTRSPCCRSLESSDISMGKGTYFDEFSRRNPSTWNHLCTKWTLLECSYNSTSGIPAIQIPQVRAWSSQNLLWHLHWKSMTTTSIRYSNEHFLKDCRVIIVN